MRRIVRHNQRIVLSLNGVRGNFCGATLIELGPITIVKHRRCQRPLGETRRHSLLSSQVCATAEYWRCGQRNKWERDCDAFHATFPCSNKWCRLGRGLMDER